MDKHDEAQKGRATVSGADQPGELREMIASMKRKLDAQGKRIGELESKREQSKQVITELRSELALVASERDRLRMTLTALEDMQTETVTLGEREVAAMAESRKDDTPSIDQLMETFSGSEDDAPSHSTQAVDPDAVSEVEEYREMISPELIVLGSSRERVDAASERYLVLLDGEAHTKCPLDQELMTIGRSDSADIQVEGDFVSRIHARVLRIGMDTVIEDAGSKNGTRVNSELVQRHVLKHGDLVHVGSAGFRYVDTQTRSDDPE